MTTGTTDAAWLTETVKRMPPYKGPGSLAGLAGRIHRLNLNESPYPPSPRVGAALAAEFGALNRYPDSHAHALSEAIAARTGIPAHRIVFGSGSEELIRALCDMSLSQGDHLVVPHPSFPVFAFAGTLRGATPIKAPLDPGGSSDAKALAAAVTSRARLVFCCTPNPPTGGMMSAAAVEEIVARVPADVLLVLDAAYDEFAIHAGGPDLLPIAARRQGPWVVLRTFSKAYSLAGLRIGYALCGSDEVAEALRKVKMNYGASMAGQVAALAALGDETYLKTCLDGVARERQRLSDGFARLGLKPWPSVANFVSARMPMPATSVMAELRRRNILIRDWRAPEFPNEIRITVGLAEDTDAVVKAIGGML